MVLWSNADSVDAYNGPAGPANNVKCLFSAVCQVSGPRMDMTLAELQEMAARQQQQIDAQQQLLASKVQTT